MTTHEKKFHRKLFVSSRIQGLFALYTIISILIVLFFLGAEFFMSITDIFGIETTTNPFSFMQTTIYGKLLILVGWGLLCYSMGILLEQNRAAGPMVNFRRSLKALIGGDLSARITLRPKDYFQDVAAEVNQLIDAFASERSKDIAAIEEIMKKAQAVKECLSKTDCPANIRSAAADLEKMLADLKAAKTRPTSKPA